jgi:hypothetical protein
MRPMKIAACLLALTLASAAFGGEIFIPATFRGNGANGSVWRTEISVTNISANPAFPVQTTITLHRENAEPLSFTKELSQHEVMSVPDALHDWFGLEDAAGIVRVTWDDPNARIGANARIYNIAGSGGQYGQGVPAVRLDRMVSDVYLPGLSGVDGNRTNVGVSNPHDRPVMIWIEMIESSGLSRGSFATSVPARSYRQFNDIFSAFQAGPLSAAMVRVTGINDTIYAYASIVRNDSGDATYVTPPE